MSFMKGAPFCYILVTVYLMHIARGELSVQWICPSADDTFGPGDIILARWGTSNDLSSPAFRLCCSKENLGLDNSSDPYDACGSAVQSVVEKSAGSYFTSLAVPNVTDENSFYLVMEDSSERRTSSPNFRISPTAVNANVENDPPAESANSSYDPSSSPVHSASGTNSISATGIASVSTSSSSPAVPYLSVARAPPPVAAFVVPLSFVGAILLGAIVLALRRHRQLKDECAANAEKIDFYRQSSFNSHYSAATGQGDIKDVSVLISGSTLPSSGCDTIVGTRPNVRQQTRQAFPATYVSRLSRQESQRTSLPSPVGPPIRCLTPSRSTFKIDLDSSNASVTNLVLPDYTLPTPSLLTPPQRLLVRDYSDTSSSYFFPHSYNHRDKPLPPILPNPISAEGGSFYNTLAYTVGS